MVANVLKCSIFLIFGGRFNQLLGTLTRELLLNLVLLCTLIFGYLFCLVLQI